MKQVILAAHFPGVNNTTVWSDPAAGSQIEFDSFAHLAQTAERGKFDFFFLAEGLRLREQRGRIHDLDVVGRPDTLTVLAALAAVTDHLGLAGTINATFNEPYELARQLATPRPPLRRPGRAGTSSPPPTRSPARTSAAAASSTTPTATSGPRSSCATARELWDSWAGDEIVADPATGTFLRDGGRRARSTTTARSSTSPATSTCRAARRAAR